MRISDLLQDTFKKFNFEPAGLPMFNSDKKTIWEESESQTPKQDENVDSLTLTPSKEVVLAKITPKGTDDSIVLAQAPKSDITIAGENKKAGIIVDIDTNVLYTYDSNGNPTKAYLIASGKKSTPTEKGVRIVTHKEKYPYRGAPASSKRRRAPRDYGPFIVCLNKINPKTGEQSSTGEFIHGCRSYHATFETDPKRYVSHGCVRMDNEAIVEVKEVTPGTIVIIK